MLYIDAWVSGTWLQVSEVYTHTLFSQYEWGDFIDVVKVVDVKVDACATTSWN